MMIGKWSQEVTINRGGAQLQPGDKDKHVYHRPDSGKSTKLGRKVEKPMDPKAGGPSGQKDRGKHDIKHTNR